MVVSMKKLLQQAKEKIIQARAIHQSIDQRCIAAGELAALILQASECNQTYSEKMRQRLLAKMMDDLSGKVGVTMITDQVFRSAQDKRAASQFQFLLEKWGSLRFLGFFSRLGINILYTLSRPCPSLVIRLIKKMMLYHTSGVILSGEKELLELHLKKRFQEKIRINLNRLGEAILGEEDAKKKLRIYLEDLQNPHIEVISVKISSICSQINLLDEQETLIVLKERLKQLYRTCKSNFFLRYDGTRVSKMVNLDMEEYRDLYLTVKLFKETLDEPEFLDVQAGIALQAYLPDSYAILQDLTQWAISRVNRGGSPIKIRIVKGANLGMERIESSLKGWPQAPFSTKKEVDAHFKKILHYALKKEHARAVRIGIGSHNLFDIAYALLLTSEQQIEECVCFEMLEGMANHVARVIHCLSGDVLLYCPVAQREEFHTAMAYLIRRLDENTDPDNFLRHLFDLKPHSQQWIQQNSVFQQACYAAESCSSVPKRNQNRRKKIDQYVEYQEKFENTPDTDWSLEANRLWVYEILHQWESKYEEIPLGIARKLSDRTIRREGFDPSRPHYVPYVYSVVEENDLEEAVKIASTIGQNWSLKSAETKSVLFRCVARKIAENRANLLGAMLTDVGKPFIESDSEISEAIDFARYYAQQLDDLVNHQGLSKHQAGVCVVASPWNFPCSIPAGGIIAALSVGYSVIFKPAPEAILVGWYLVNIFWDAGIPREALQFVTCEDEPLGSRLIQDPRVDTVILTGSTQTARKFLSLKPHIKLFAETGGKNAIIVSASSDRDLAVKDIVYSAFGYSGQKCSACSLVILEEEVYHDPTFKRQLVDATESLSVGSAWDLSSRIIPLIRTPESALYRALTSCEREETWLLQPQKDSLNPSLWSPGIKMGVTQKSFMHQTELFGPVLSVMCAKNLDHAINIANATPYGLTSGLHSLDSREHQCWFSSIQAGNCYINRGITGAIVSRQPFGGCKESSWGIGMKAGGPHYLVQLRPSLWNCPSKKREVLPQKLMGLFEMAQKEISSHQVLDNIQNAFSHYYYAWETHFSQAQQQSNLLGQDNRLSYRAHKTLYLYLAENAEPIHLFLVFAAAVVAGTSLVIYSTSSRWQNLFHTSFWTLFLQEKGWLFCDVFEKWAGYLVSDECPRIRCWDVDSFSFLSRQVIEKIRCIDNHIPYEDGRVELLYYLREVSLSFDYHRYGNLQDRVLLIKN